MKKIKVENIINLIMFLYILTLYIFTYQEGLNLISNIIGVLFMGLVWIKKIYKGEKIVLNGLSIFYLLFIVICLFSSLYAINASTSFVKSRTLFALLILMVSFINYIDTGDKLYKLMAYFAYSGLITSLYIIFSSDFSDLIRFGSDLGNVNAIGMILAISSTFSFYFILERKAYRFIAILLINSATTFLTGSRKSLVFLVFTLLVLAWSKTDRKSFIVSRIKSLVIGLIILAIIFYATFKIPIFYQIIGKRMENLFDYLSGEGTSEGSINMRVFMTQLGWGWFKERPFFGYGINNYRFLLGQTIGWATYAHNNLIELLVGIGIFGTAVYYILQLYLIRDLYKVSKVVSKTLAYTFMSMILAYVFMSAGLIYYDSKHFCIILAVSSIIARLYKEKEINFDNNKGKKR